MIVICLFAYGDSGKSNQDLINELNDFPDNWPIFTQKMVAKEIKKIFPTRQIIVSPQKGDHISSFALIERFLAEKKKHADWTSAKIIAAEQHYERLERDFQKVDFPIICRSINIGYFPEDPLWWVHNKHLWKFRELIISCLPFWLYKWLSRRDY